jgi:hypothetical protein
VTNLVNNSEIIKFSELQGKCNCQIWYNCVNFGILGLKKQTYTVHALWGGVSISVDLGQSSRLRQFMLCGVGQIGILGK